MKTNRMILLLIGILCCVISGCSFAGKTQKPIVLKVADIHPEAYPTMQATIYLSKLVDERSKGRIKMDIYPSGQLGQAKEISTALDEGIIDIDREGIDNFVKDIPELEAIMMPYLFRDSDHVWKVLDGEVGKEITASFDKKNRVLLCYYDSGARSFYATKPINTPEDLVGASVRVLDTAIFKKTMQILGATPLVLGYADVYPSLQLGKISGAENNPPSYLTSKHYELAPYYVLDEHIVVPEGLFINKNNWDKLGAEDQKLIKECSEEAGKYQRKLWKEFTEKALKELREKGVTIITPDKKLFREKVAPIYQEYPQFQEMVKKIQAVN